MNRQPFVFDEIVAARFVEFTARDNFFVAPGDGETPGGDRVGLGEIAFPVYSLGTLPGDFDGSNTVDIADIDILTRSIADGSQDAIFDLNLDGAINSDDIRHWSTSLARTWIGDADLDGKFDSKDFVIVFTAAEYDDGIPNNSTWSTGDWNGDGDFNSGDFVFAFVENGFEKGARIGVVSVPEPDHCMPLILVAVAAVIRQAFRKRRA